VAEGWRGLQNEKLQNLYTSPNIITIIKSRRKRWVGNVARMGKMKNPFKILVGNLKGRNHLDLREVACKIVDYLA
jgi:hypothetical protein